MRRMALALMALGVLGFWGGYAHATSEGLPSCKLPKQTANPDKLRGSPEIRKAAQRGLDFLAAATADWGQRNKCFGCHTQGVTLEALSVGMHHQYKIDAANLKSIVDVMLTGAGGGRRTNGFSYQERMYLGTAKSFGGNALARYDALVAQDLRHDLLQVAGELLQFQAHDGSMSSDYPISLPVHVGPLQRTYQAAQTWRQAYARSADDRWLTPIANAERYLRQVSMTFQQQPPSETQELNYALLGLVASGVGGKDGVVGSLSREVLSRQNHDGGWGYQRAGTSNALATGESVYALRMLGLTDRDNSVGRGSSWLVQHQNSDGGWSNAGSAKAEAMWAVLGLVSTDVMTVSVSGVIDGQHVDGKLRIGGEARDNSGEAGGVTQIEVTIDDVTQKRVCGTQIDYSWETASLKPGKHLVDISATNAKGQISSRRLEVFAGDVYLTQIGTRADDSGTFVSLRDIAPAAQGGSVELQISPVSDGKTVPKTITVLTQPSTEGALTFFWDGKGPDKKPAAPGKYTARLVYRDSSKKIRQTEETVIVRDTVANQQANYGQVSGRIAMPAAAPRSAGGLAANAEVDLVDDKGRVLQSVRSTAEGQYRFKNIDAGKYKVRVRKQGYAPVESEVKAPKGAEAQSDLHL